MNLIRLLLIAAIFWLVFSLVKRWLRQNAAPRRKSTPPSGHERMVKCVYCGLHVPESEAVREGDLTYCSIEHRNAHAPRG